MEWVNAIVQGILLGGLFALFATGLSLAFGVMRFVNLAHGDLAILAAFLAVSFSSTLDVNPFVTMALVVPIMAAGGMCSSGSGLTGRLAPTPFHLSWSRLVWRW